MNKWEGVTSVMVGNIVETCFFDETKTKHGFIKGTDGIKYYFNEGSTLRKVPIDTFFEGDRVSFSVEKTAAKYDKAIHIQLMQQSEGDLKAEFSVPGISRRMNLERAEVDHLKAGSLEREVIEQLAKVLRITHVGHHTMDQVSTYQFCLASTTEFFKQFIRETGEFIIVFSSFESKSWQQKTLKVERELRKRRDIADRRPLVNFYILISNATELRDKINGVKGEPQAAIIPFSFEELLSCQTKEELLKCMLDRFGEYYFENNMLGENQAIDDDNLLFGDRGKIADAVVARCSAGSNSGIFGLRRSGKTSVLNAVLRRLSWEETPYVLLESRTYETFPSWKSVLFDIATLVRMKFSKAERRAGESRAAFYERLELNSTEEDYEKRATACFIEDIAQYRGDESLVIAIDEIELITYNTATSDVWKNLDAYKGFWSALRGCGCPLVVCGVNSTINEVSNLSFNGMECDNPMYGRITNCTESSKTYLPAFSDEQTKVMINTLGRYSNIGFTNVYASINRAFGGQPWAIRQFCSYIFSNVKNLRDPARVYEVSKATCDNLMREFKSSAVGVQLCQTILQHLRIYTSEYALLKKIALNPEKYSVVSSGDAMLIDHLQKYSLIEYDVETQYVSFCIDIIKEYIQKNETKLPEDMNNTERRHYIQDGVALCEKKLKKYILNYFTYASSPVKGRGLFFTSNGKCVLKAHNGIDIGTCTFEDFLDHKKFDFYFSKLRTIIEDNWATLGAKFEEQGISKSRFDICMLDLNAGRTDADHYDPENDNSVPTAWEVDNETLDSFCTALRTLNRFFDACKL